MTLHTEAKELIRSGRLADARTHLTAAVKGAPADLGLRTLLFQVLAFCGEWDKAEKQLGVVSGQQPEKETGVQVYLNLVRAERERLEVIRLKRRPSFLPTTPDYAEMYFAAWDKVVGAQIEEAQELFDQIRANRPSEVGTLNGRSFNGFRDTDSFLSCFLEILLQSRYVWVPFEAIREIFIAPPKTLFDLIWLPARITTSDAMNLACFLPVVYPLSYEHEDERVRMGRMTDWVPLGGPFSRGCGQHVFEVGEEEVALLDIQELLFTTPSGDSAI